MSQRLWVRNDWDRRVVEAITAGDEYRLRPLAAAGKDVRWIVDIGAHVGGFALAAKTLWPQSRLIAVEPSSDAAPFFDLNTAGLSGVEHVQKAIVRRGSPDRVRLSNMRDENYAARFTVEVVEELTTDVHVNLVEWAATTDVLSLLAEFGSPSIDILKLDCEGAETLILQELAAAGYLARVAYICGEWHYRPSVALIGAALRETHELELYETDSHPWGAFFARPRS